MTKKKRSAAQTEADDRYESKRASQPRFGGRCSEEEKRLLSELCKEDGLTEKELIFTALRFYKKNSKETKIT